MRSVPTRWRRFCMPRAPTVTRARWIRLSSKLPNGAPESGRRVIELKIVIFGLSITSSWGNGHATTYRALARTLEARGHHIVFFEGDREWFAPTRHIPQPPFCRLYIYESWNEILPAVRRELADSDVALVGSYFPDGLRAIEELFDSRAEVKAFYDIDTPITMAGLRNGGTAYL